MVTVKGFTTDTRNSLINPTMSPLLEAIRYNNEGVRQLESTTTFHSTHGHCTAMAFVRRALHVLHAALPQRSKAAAAWLHPLDQAVAVLKRTREEQPILLNNRKETNLFFIFRQPLLISPHGNESRYALVHRVCVMLVFNLALLHHQLCHWTGRTATARLAHDLYRILCPPLCPGSMQRTPRDTNVLHVLSLNNLACLYYEQWHDYTACRTCLHRLYVLNHVLDTVSITRPYLSAVQRDELQLNLLYLRRAPTAAAAAENVPSWESERPRHIMLRHRVKVNRYYSTLFRGLVVEWCQNLKVFTDRNSA